MQAGRQRKSQQAEIAHRYYTICPKHDSMSAYQDAMGHDQHAYSIVAIQNQLYMATLLFCSISQPCLIPSTVLLVGMICYNGLHHP